MPVRRSVLACAAAALLFGVRADAQSNSDPDAQWGAHAGVLLGADVDGTHPSAGLHWRPRLTGAIGLELSAGYDRPAWGGAAGTVTADHVPVEGSILFHFFYTRRVQPYLLAGVSYHWINPHGGTFSNGDPYQAQNLFGLQAGAGVDVRAGEKLSFWLDGRWAPLDVDAVTDLGLKADTIRVAAGVNVGF